MTYSIVALDDRTGELGVAVQSHFFGAGKVVPWALAGVGAVATQAFANPAFGPEGLASLSAGAGAQETLARLLAADPQAELRQLAVLDAGGAIAVHTGGSCYPVAEHETEAGVSAQGNMLRNPGTARAMVAAFQAASGALADRLLAALEAAEASGGEARGQQAAGLIVVGGDPQASSAGPALVDLRVEDSPQPLAELRRLRTLDRGYEQLGGLFASEVLGGAQMPGADSVEAALAAIDASLTLLADRAEPVMWQAIVLARAGRPRESRAAAELALARSPELAAFLARLQAAGVVPAGTWPEALPRR
jgi:uncharacterized Ntn-hydrolase superfamily protein